MPFVAFKAKVYDLLVADSVLVALLSTVPGTSRPAVYVNHLAQFAAVTYPAVSLFWANAGADQAVQQAEAGVLLIDIWTEETPASPWLTSGESGAWTIRDRIKTALHRAHLTRRLASAAYQLSYCVELDTSLTEDFDREQRLHHLQARYRVHLVAAGAVQAYPH